jgi:hypothetical protein
MMMRSTGLHSSRGRRVLGRRRILMMSSKWM